jgi:hypothetical protein
MRFDSSQRRDVIMATQAVTTVREAAASHRAWLLYLARAGYAARGVVYVLVGVLAFMAAFGSQRAEGTRGALAWVMDEPWGPWLIGFVGVGLIGYSLWRFFQSAMDADNHGTDAKGLAIRTGLFVSAVTHILLAIFCFSLVFGNGGGGEENTQGWTAELMSQPFGRWLVAIVGLCVIGAGIAQFVKGATKGFDKYLSIPADHRNWAVPTSQAGLIARGIVFLMIGGFFLIAAYQADPSEAKGLEESLATLQQQPFGPWLLAAMGIGLIAFAIYSFLQALYRRINVPV